MIITLTRTGGFTGIPLRKTIDTTTLPKEKAQEIEQIVAHCDFTLLPKVSENNLPDQFTYTLAIHNQEIAHDVILKENHMDESMRNLISAIQNI